ncbi:MAG: glutamate racemase [Alphaproteobacteria bacterium]|nr:MAG: glutamate racemase [Alphaproteobacteria bacterium]
MTIEMVDALFHQGCPLVILACNTSAAVALRTVQQGWLARQHADKRVLGVLVPTVEELTGKPWIDPVAHPPGGTPPRTIAVFATQKTVESGAYVEEVAKRDPNIRVVQQAAPALVPLIEAGAPPDVMDAAVAETVAALARQVPLARVSAVLLGCTHFPLIESVFRRHLPAHTDIISQPRIVAAALKDYLVRHPRFSAPAPARTLRYLSTGDPAAADRVARRLTALDIAFAPLRPETERPCAPC